MCCRFFDFSIGMAATKAVSLVAAFFDYQIYFKWLMWHDKIVPVCKYLPCKDFPKKRALKKADMVVYSSILKDKCKVG